MLRLLPLLALLLCGFAPAPFKKPAKPSPVQDDLLALQGQWDEVGAPGGPMRARPNGVVYAFVGNHVTVTQHERVCSKWYITLDLSKNPRRMIFAPDKASGTTGGFSYQYTLEPGAWSALDHKRYFVRKLR